MVFPPLGRLSEPPAWIKSFFLSNQSASHNSANTSVMPNDSLTRSIGLLPVPLVVRIEVRDAHPHGVFDDYDLPEPYERSPNSNVDILAG